MTPPGLTAAEEAVSPRFLLPLVSLECDYLGATTSPVMLHSKLVRILRSELEAVWIICNFNFEGAAIACAGRIIPTRQPA